MSTLQSGSRNNSYSHMGWAIIIYFGCYWCQILRETIKNNLYACLFSFVFSLGPAEPIYFFCLFSGVRVKAQLGVKSSTPLLKYTDKKKKWHRIPGRGGIPFPGMMDQTQPLFMSGVPPNAISIIF